MVYDLMFQVRMIRAIRSVGSVVQLYIELGISASGV